MTPPGFRYCERGEAVSQAVPLKHPQEALNPILGGQPPGLHRNPMLVASDSQPGEVLTNTSYLALNLLLS